MSNFKRLCPLIEKDVKLLKCKRAQCIFILKRYQKAKHYKKAHHSLTEVGNRIPNLFLNMTTTNLTVWKIGV